MADYNDLDILGLDERADEAPENNELIADLSQKAVEGARMRGVVEDFKLDKDNHVTLYVFVTDFEDPSDQPAVRKVGPHEYQFKVVTETPFTTEHTDKLEADKNSKFLPRSLRLSGADEIIKLPARLVFSFFKGLESVKMTGCTQYDVIGRECTLLDVKAHWSIALRSGFSSFRAREARVGGPIVHERALYEPHARHPDFALASCKYAAMESMRHVLRTFNRKTGGDAPRAITFDEGENGNDVTDSGMSDGGADSQLVSANTQAPASAVPVVPVRVVDAETTALVEFVKAHLEPHSVLPPPPNWTLPDIFTAKASVFENAQPFMPINAHFYPNQVIERPQTSFVFALGPKTYEEHHVQGIRLFTSIDMLVLKDIEQKSNKPIAITEKCSVVNFGAIMRCWNPADTDVPPVEYLLRFKMYDPPFGIHGEALIPLFVPLLESTKHIGFLGHFEYDRNGTAILGPGMNGATQIAMTLVASSLRHSLPFIVRHAGYPLSVANMQRLVAQRIFKANAERIMAELTDKKDPTVVKKLAQQYLKKFLTSEPDSETFKNFLAKALQHQGGAIGLPSAIKASSVALTTDQGNVFNLFHATIDITRIVLDPKEWQPFLITGYTKTNEIRDVISTGLRDPAKRAYTEEALFSAFAQRNSTLIRPVAGASESVPEEFKTALAEMTDAALTNEHIVFLVRKSALAQAPPPGGNEKEFFARGIKRDVDTNGANAEDDAKRAAVEPK